MKLNLQSAPAQRSWPTVILVGALLCIAAATVVVKHAELPVARVTVRVVDEMRRPIPGVSVRLAFVDRRDPRRYAGAQGLTDAEGLFTGEGGCDAVVGSVLEMRHYYAGSAPIPHFRETDSTGSRWLPWKPTIEAVLRRIENPIAMYAKDSWIDIPSANEPCGYDLQSGDWVAPYGKGKQSDVVFRLTRTLENRDNYSVAVEISFSNEGDGIQRVELPKEWSGSVFRWPRQAPESGYEQTLTAHCAVSANSAYEGNLSREQRYFFRVRTVKQNGQTVSALYGKINGGLHLDAPGSKTCKVRLAYYLNPTPLDRNMEWDPQQNLLKGLSRDETPRDP